MHVLTEKLGAEEFLQEIDAREHGRGSLLFPQEGKEQAGFHKFESLDERAICFVIINGVHLGDEDIHLRPLEVEVNFSLHFLFFTAVIF